MRRLHHGHGNRAQVGSHHDEAGDEQPRTAAAEWTQRFNLLRVIDERVIKGLRDFSHKEINSRSFQWLSNPPLLPRDNEDEAWRLAHVGLAIGGERGLEAVPV